MTFHVLSLVLAGILSFADYVTEQIFSKKLMRNQKLVSFSSGAAVSYIILNLFPEIASYALIDGKKLFIYALLGFVSLNLIEQFIYKNMGRLGRAHSYHKQIHITYFFIYNFFIGIVLVSFSTKGLAKTLLFFIPFLLYIIAEILPQEFAFKNNLFKILYSMAPVFGAIIGVYYIDYLSSLFGSLISFITGTLLYIVIKEFLPTEDAEKPLYFILGIVFYALIISFSWIF